MRRTIALGTLAASLLLAGGSTLGGTALGATPTAPAAAAVDRTGHLLRFDVETSPFKLIDVDRDGQLSDGDEIVFHDTLLQHGRRVGDQLGSCVIVDATEALANCTMVIRLPEGKITAAFDNAPPPTKTLAITGGTGRYRKAHGEGTLVEAADQTAILTLRVLP
jgi:hypothetical protein